MSFGIFKIKTQIFILIENHFAFLQDIEEQKIILNVVQDNDIDIFFKREESLLLRNNFVSNLCLGFFSFKYTARS